jgi:hypothetical protein
MLLTLQLRLSDSHMFLVCNSSCHVRPVSYPASRHFALLWDVQRCKILAHFKASTMLSLCLRFVSRSGALLALDGLAIEAEAHLLVLQVPLAKAEYCTVRVVQIQ